MKLDATIKAPVPFKDGEELKSLEYLLKNGMDVLTMSNDLESVSMTVSRAKALMETLRKNERGCSQEELDTVSEIITNNPSYKITEEQCDAVYKEGVSCICKTLDAAIDRAMEFYEQFLAHTSKVDETCNKVVKETTITNFTEGYPSFVLDEFGLPTDAGEKPGVCSVDNCLNAYNEGIKVFMDRFNNTISSLKQDGSAGPAVVEGKRKVFCNMFPKLYNAGMALLQFRALFLNKLGL